MRAYERLLHYVTFDTTSDENAPEGVCPSTEKQRKFGAALVEEMKRLGISDAHQDPHGYLYGTIPANCPDRLPVIGLISHMDTSPDAPGKNIRPRIVRKYAGGDIVLNRERNIVLRASEFPALAGFRGQDLMVTDGNTLLGADDKAGIAEILTAAEELQNETSRTGKSASALPPTRKSGAAPTSSTLLDSARTLLTRWTAAASTDSNAKTSTRRARPSP